MDLYIESNVLACCHKGSCNTFDYFFMHYVYPRIYLFSSVTVAVNVYEFGNSLSLEYFCDCDEKGILCEITCMSIVKFVVHKWRKNIMV